MPANHPGMLSDFLLAYDGINPFQVNGTFNDYEFRQNSDRGRLVATADQLD